MIKRFFRALAIASGLIVLTLFIYFYLSLTSTPHFIVKNETKQVANITAYWLDQKKRLGKLSAGESLSFEVDAEASMLIEATFDSGNNVKGAIGYFTTGSNFEAAIQSNTILITAL